MTQHSASVQKSEQPPGVAEAAGQLVVVEGPNPGRRVRVESSLTVGRAPDAQLMLDDPSVSRRHARVLRGALGACHIEDLGSRNGTFVNGARTRSAPLTLGDRIRIGSHIVLEFRRIDPAEEHLMQRQRLEALGRLAAGSAHDLKNFLAAIDAGCAFLQELPAIRSLGEQEVHDCVSDMSLAARRCGEIARGMLTLARGGQNGRSAVDLAALVREVLRLLRHAIDRDIRVEPALDRGVFVHGNKAELQQVLLNLCINARDAMPDGGVLQVAVRKSAEAAAGLGWPGCSPAAVLTVSDSGVGMDEATVSRIFDQFFTTKGEGRGYGLGLGAVREIVSRHGGQVAVRSQLAHGSAFSVVLPVVKPNWQRLASTQDRREGSGLPCPPGSVTVLLVDDERLVRRSVGRRLRQAGFAVTEAESGAAALESYTRARYDLVLLDLDMPGLDGEATHARLVELDPQARVAFVTGYVDEARRSQALGSGALALLEKPFEMDALIELVRENLGDAFIGDDEPPTQVE